MSQWLMLNICGILPLTEMYFPGWCRFPDGLDMVVLTVDSDALQVLWVSWEWSHSVTYKQVMHSWHGSRRNVPASFCGPCRDQAELVFLGRVLIYVLVCPGDFIEAYGLSFLVKAPGCVLWLWQVEWFKMNTWLLFRDSVAWHTGQAA
jgi:hypothetical protein